MYKTRNKKIISLLISFCLILSFVVGVFGTKIDSYAEDVSITLALWPTEVGIGDTLTATITVSGEYLGDYDIFLEYPTSILEYTGGDNTGTIEIIGSGNNSYSYNFKAIAEGTGKLQTSGYKIYSLENQQLSVVHAGGNITVGEVQAEDDSIKIGNEVYTLVNDRYLPAAPEGYDLSYVTYKGKDIYAYQAPNQKIKVVCLQNSQWEQKWFVFNEEDESFSPFVEYSLDGIKYVFINKPDDVKMEDGLEETNLTLNGSQITAYKEKSDNGLYLIYGLNASGYSGFFYYDTEDGSIMRYDAVKQMIDYATANCATAISEEDESEQQTTTEKKYATPLIPETEKDEEDDGMLSKETLRKLLYTMVVLFIIMCVVVIILVVRNGILTNQLYGDEDDDDDDDDDVVYRAKTDDKKTQEVAKSDASKDGIFTKTGKNNSYDVNEDTGEILLMEAEDNNAGVNVPPAEDDASKIEQAMKERPYGMDSAFDVVSAAEAPQGENVYIEPEPVGFINIPEGMVDPSRFDSELDREDTERMPEDLGAALASETEQVPVEKSESTPIVNLNDVLEEKKQDAPDQSGNDFYEQGTEVLVADSYENKTTVLISEESTEAGTEVLVADQNDQAITGNFAENEDTKNSKGFKKKNRKKNKKKRFWNKEQDNEPEDIEELKPVQEIQDTKADQEVHEIKASQEIQEQPEQPVKSEEMKNNNNSEKTKPGKADKKQHKAPQKVALPGMDDEEDE